MTTRFKTLALASALAFGTLEPAGAAFVRPAITYTAAAAAATAATLPSEAHSASAANTRLTGTRAVREKSNFFKRIGQRLGAMAGKSQLIALILSILLGGLAIDRFYLGHIGTGILKLITFGGFGIWYIIDIILIATGDLEPKNGSYDETL